MSDNASINSFFDRFWKWRLDHNPEFATAIGIRGYDGRLDDLSKEHLATKHQDLVKFSKDIDELEKNINDKSSNSFVDLKILKCDINDYIAGLRFQPCYFPVNQLEGPQSTFPRLISWMKRDTLKDYENILLRLEQFPRQINQRIDLMKDGIQSRLVMHAVSVSDVPSQIGKLIELQPEKSELFKPFLSFPDSFDAVDRDRLKSRGFSVVENDVLPAFRLLQRFIKEEYLSRTRPSIAISSLANGKEYYQACLKFHTTTLLTPDEIQKTGLEEVDRILSRVAAIKDDVGFEGDVKTFLSYLRTDKKFLFQDKNEIMTYYNDVCSNIEKKIPQLFNKFPKKAFEVHPVPEEYAEAFPGAYYLSASIDGTRPGTFYVNTSFAEKRCKNEAVSLALHEAIPGHHHQISLSLELDGEPAFKKYIEDDSYYACPARFNMCSAFCEGWGLYSEYLGEELGLYNNPYDLLGRLSHELLRASRLVVDTGMHWFDWSKEKAAAYMGDNTCTSENDIIAEVDRYITWPGQACAYKIGEITIKRLRSKAEKTLGDKFDVKAFHNAVLMHGNIPLHVLEGNIERFIVNNQ